MNTNTVDLKNEVTRCVVEAWREQRSVTGAVTEIMELITQHHQAELAEVYREILEEQSTYDNYNNTQSYQAVSVKEIEALAERRGIVISDKKTDHE